MKKLVLLAFAVFAAALIFAPSCGSTHHLISSKSYQGHESVADSNNFVRVYKNTLGTRLDDCQTCHLQGIVVNTAGNSFQLSACDYCHIYALHPDNNIVSGAPTSYHETLNPYGIDYLGNGRDRAALVEIGPLDSDGDNYSNDTEINALYYPGDNGSVPGQPLAPCITVSWSEINSMDNHMQFLLMNAAKQQFDEYALYNGVKVKVLLEQIGVDLSNATSISFIAPDGFAKTITLDNVNGAFPAGLYYPGLSASDFADPNQGFVTYPASQYIPGGMTNGGAIPDEQWLQIAYWREGAALTESYIDTSTGKLEGEGPYRLVVPQNTPGSPDRGSKYSPSGYADGYDYDAAKDHNAGACVRGLVAIRINPMPAGYEEPDWKNQGLSLIMNKQIIVYGCGVTGE
jgi:hypothetical protein